jgi:hypothetical protein
VLEAVFVLLEYPSPSRRIFIDSHSLPPSLVRRIGPLKGQDLVAIDIVRRYEHCFIFVVGMQGYLEIP